MKTEKLNITGMSCGHCIMAVKKELTSLSINVKKVEIGSAEIEYDENKIKREKILEAIKEAGYEVNQK